MRKLRKSVSAGASKPPLPIERRKSLIGSSQLLQQNRPKGDMSRLIAMLSMTASAYQNSRYIRYDAVSGARYDVMEIRPHLVYSTNFGSLSGEPLAKDE